MREHVRPFTAGAGRHSRTHCARKSPIESQATGSESRGEMVAGGAAISHVWKSDRSVVETRTISTFWVYMAYRELVMAALSCW